MQDYKYHLSLYQLPLKGKGATESTRRARVVRLFPQTRELLPASHVSVASATLQQIVTDRGPPPRAGICQLSCKSSVPTSPPQRRSVAARWTYASNQTRRRTDDADSQVLVRLICALNHSAMEITWRRSRLADGRTDGRTRTERWDAADAVHDSALVSVVVAVADGRSSSIPDGGLKSETAPEPKSCQTG